ncbi:uncharacterized protein LOC108024078 isoform X2 [Drosophila biarmipes]|nr:uncharacterized protein LOC108024078 isoform X2 [Drosophila biarmipes]
MDFRIVLNILMDALERTKSMLPAANQKQFTNVRLILYRVISLWCSTLQEGSHCEIISETLVKEILDDLVMRNETSFGGDESNSKTKTTTKNIFSMLEVSFNKEDYDILRSQAHFCLQQLLLSSGHLIKKQILKEMHNALLGICVTIHSEPTTIEALQNIWDCRLEVYKTFEYLIKLRNYECLTPSEIILNLLNESRSFVNNIELRQSYYAHFQELMVHPDKMGIQFQEGFNNLMFCHTNICVSKNSRCLSPIDIAQSNIHNENAIVNQNNLQNSSCDDNSQYSNKDHLNEISTKIVNRIAYEKNIPFDAKSLNEDNVQKKNNSQEKTSKDLLNKCNESSDSCLLFNDDEIKPGLASSYRSVEEHVKVFPMDNGKSDDAKLIADLEAIFVCELK